MAFQASPPRYGKRKPSTDLNPPRKVPRAHERARPSTQARSVHAGASDPPADERFAVHEGEREVGPQRTLPRSSRVSTIQVQDHSTHHYGDNHTTHNIQETTNFVGNVGNATFGPNSVTTIDRAVFSSGNEAALLWDTLPKQRDTVVQQNEYLEESREDVVQYVLGWSQNPTSELALFIVGAAGIGKSTLARHLTYRLHAVGQLAAFVSLSALPSDARSPENAVKLTSREIGGTHPEAIPAILEAIKSCKGAPLVEYVEMFLIGPVRSLGLSYSLTVIFDAVDEYQFHAALVKSLSSLPLSSSSLIKFILLGRSDLRARGIDHGSIRSYQLQPVPIPVMERFLANEFDGVRWGHGRRPAPSHVTKLAELTNGLFIWATVVCSLLKKRLSRFAPDHILDSILDARKTLGDGEQLATLYHQAITLLFPDSDARDLLREYLTATLALQESLPIDEFSDLTGLPISVVETIQSDLKALQIRHPGEGEEEDSMVYPAADLFHLSFLEYLRSTSTPPHITFHIALCDSHSQLAEFCLRELPRFLPSSHFLYNIDLSPKQRYSVTYIMTHLHCGTPSVEPGASDEWERSRHCAILRQISFDVLEQWADLFVRLVKPEPVIEECHEDSNDSRNTCSGPEEFDATEGSGEHGYHDGRDERDAGSQSNDTELARSDYGLEREANRDDVDAPRQDVDHDTRVAQLLQGVAAVFWEERYTTRPSFQVDCLGVAVRLRPDDAELWYLLGWAYGRMTHWSVSVEAHDRAVTAHRNALRGVDEHTGRDPGRLPCGLATAHHERFKAFGRSEDLDQAIALHRDGLAMRPPGHPQREWSLNNLASTLGSRIDERGLSSAEIDEVIRLQREALALLPAGDEHTTMYLRNLALKLMYRYEMSGFIVDLEEAIQLGREALALCPPSRTERASSLTGLAWDLTFLYEAQGDSRYRDEAISLAKESLSLRPTSHPSRWDTLETLSNALRLHPNHIDEALQLSRECLSLMAPNHSSRWFMLFVLASVLLSHNQSSGAVEELEEAILVCKQALLVCPPNHFRRPKLLVLQAKLAEARSSPHPTHEIRLL